jgi:hypothetical protein
MPKKDPMSMDSPETNLNKEELSKPFVQQEDILAKELIGELSVHHENEIVQKKLSITQTNEVLESIAKTKGISRGTAIRAVGALFRRGAANARAKDTISVDVTCFDTKKSTSISRYDVAMALYGVVEHKVIRKLAESMAPLLIQASISLLSKDETIDHRGDLANKIDKKLFKMGDPEKYPPLTRKEQICCSTYAQWMPNLNTLADSTRLKGLLEQDLAGRLDPKKPKSSKGKSQKTKEAAKQKANSSLKAAKAAQAAVKKQQGKK